MSRKTGVLLVNLGTPDSPRPKDVHKYLVEFLTDGRVVDKPWIFRQLLVRGFIVPLRYRQSAKSYGQIWMKQGSPLMVYSQKVKVLLQEALGCEYIVELAMRYQNPSIGVALKALVERGIEHLIVIPLFPQYASATTGSVHERVLDIVSKYEVIPKLTLIRNFASDPFYIEAVCTIAREYPLKTYDHFLFSFHGLPERHLTKANAGCLQSQECCGNRDETSCKGYFGCYKAECLATATAIAKALGIDDSKFSITFQSRLGKEPWLTPFTNETIQKLAMDGKKQLLVFCPSFVSDCLETIHEIGIEYAAEFVKHGGEALHYVKSLNDHPKWIHALEAMVRAE